MNETIKTCERCGAEYSRPKDISARQWAGRRFCSKKCSATKLTLDLQAIADAYEKGKSSVSIALDVGCSDVHIRRILHQQGVKLRPPELFHSAQFLTASTRTRMSESAKGRPLPESAKEKLRELYGQKNSCWRGGITHNVQGYVVYTSSRANGHKSNMLIHRAVAEEKYGRKLGRLDYVHHIDGNKKNNHPDNLVVLSPSEHNRLHAQERKNGKSKQV